MAVLIIFFFFFSSRRRHTRCYRDWSSDVCSSDLPGETVFLGGRRLCAAAARGVGGGEDAGAGRDRGTGLPGEGGRVGRPHPSALVLFTADGRRHLWAVGAGRDAPAGDRKRGGRGGGDRWGGVGARVHRRAPAGRGADPRLPA